MEIPKKFKVAGFDINVEFIDKLDSNDYGNWCDVTNVIKLAKNISLANGELTPLQNRQIENTFLHELYHVFQFYSGKRYSEEECNIFANFMLEYFESKQ